MDFLTALLQHQLEIVTTIVATALTAYLIKAWQEKAASLSKDQWVFLNWIISTAVWSAEQAWRMGLIDKNFRLEYAVELVQKEINARGLPGIKVEEIMVKINTAVAQELNKAKIVAPTVTLGLTEPKE